MNLQQQSTVKVIKKQYIFNNKNEYNDTYYITNSTYTFLDIPKDHPMAILNKSISVEGDKTKKMSKEVDGVEYDFYYGNLTMTVSNIEQTISVYCYYHGYMGGKNILKYKLNF
tara:strand:- start:700 stop:1038 length:339 start_codon:yes stop_codon:yes gene_type:complete